MHVLDCEVAMRMNGTPRHKTQYVGDIALLTI